MQFLGFPPRAVTAVFAKVFHDQTHIFEMTDARVRMPEPEALRIIAHQGCRTLAQLRRSRRRRRQFAQFIMLGSHERSLKMRELQGKPLLP